MKTALATFATDEHGPVAALDALAALGFSLVPTGTVTRTLLDSFDGLANAAGLRVELRQTAAVRTEAHRMKARRDGQLRLVLRDERHAEESADIVSVPRFARDLPDGAARDTLMSIVGVRALLPLIEVHSQCTLATKRDDHGRIVGSAALHRDLRVDGHDLLDLAPWAVDFETSTGNADLRKAIRRSLAAIGMLVVNGDTLDHAAAAAGIDLRGFRGSPTVALDPGMRSVDGYRRVLKNLADTLIANWQGTIDGVDPEFLHDLRVAVRRTRTVLSEGRDVLPPAIVERGRDRFAWMGEITGPARDLDVHLIEWAGYTSSLTPNVIAALEPVLTTIRHDHAAARAQLASALNSAQARELIAAWQLWLSEPLTDEPHGSGAREPLGRTVSDRIQRAQTRVIGQGRLITPASPGEQLHDLRKATKKLRYLLECFGSLLDDGARNAFVHQLKSLQDNLGEYQDAEVHIAQLRAMAERTQSSGGQPGSLRAVDALADVLDVRRRVARDEFAGRFAAYDSKMTRRALKTALAPLSD